MGHFGLKNGEFWPKIADFQPKMPHKSLRAGQLCFRIVPQALRKVSAKFQQLRIFRSVITKPNKVIFYKNGLKTFKIGIILKFCCSIGFWKNIFCWALDFLLIELHKCSNMRIDLQLTEFSCRQIGDFPISLLFYYTY